MNIVILAAGLGKRMHSDLPKVLHPLAGKPLLQYVLESARALKPAKLCVVYGLGGNAVPERFGGDGAVMVKQEPQLGTGHALKQALPQLVKDGITLVLCGDVPLIAADTLKRMLKPNQLTLMTVELDDPAGYGRIVRGKDGNVVRIVEQKDASAAEKKIREVNTGIMALPTSQLPGWLSKLGNKNAQKEYYLTDVVALAIKDGVKVSAVQPQHVWETLGVNSKAQLAQLERLYQTERAHQLLEQGVTIADPERIDIRGELACGRDVEIDIGCIFEGAVALGNNVKVGAYCVLKDVKIAAGTELLPYCVIEGAEIGRDCRVGPYSRIRPGTLLDAGAHIGNFVEVKNSRVGLKSKANHLSYVGDTTVGKNVNIGAGTITCNYDGANKHRTVIEDDVFIGSDTQLVAPVTVHKGATIGAGTTVTRDAPAGELTISRVKQVSVSGWKRPVRKTVRSKE
ncbi:MAG TPA: bifunctional UDP-N-acetylglucosamine diphosphorylase/glucosamine-1-phosphate N-acetyltransferase GlmU [Burkholderiales bacterium]|nr:bifunctional UDP-N-acetylglucosamine diphosphorylase/glucosamine-1-phosphate N-acetyltransferase GlmU [Burkholderiales bacterium]